jgi:hypothetical protein
VSALGPQRWCLHAACALLLFTASSLPALAQEPAPPTGPAQIFQRNAEHGRKTDLARAEQAAQAAKAGRPSAADAATPPAAPEPGTGSAGAAQAEPEAGAAPHDHVHGHAMLSPPSQPAAEEASDLPMGTIAIEVTAPNGAPYAEAPIMLGVMSSSSSRTEQRATADHSGRYTFRGLATGSSQAYRVNVAYGGAKFSSTPFRLPEHAGYRVRIPLQETTRNDRLFIQLSGQTVVELRDDRLHITQQARLANAGSNVYVLPPDGVVIPLPEGHTAFTWQDQMTDQKGEAVAGKGFKLRGSFPPGTANLAWTYDLPRSGDSARIQVSLPWKTYRYVIASEAPDGLKLRVSEFPEAERVNYQGRWLLVTEIQNQPGSPSFAAFNIKLDGIPGPGPGRWIAVVLAVLLVGFGLSRAFTRADDSAERKQFIDKRKQQLLAEARAADAEHARGESGPEYLARRLGEIEIELALLLRDEEMMGQAKPSAG